MKASKWMASKENEQTDSLSNDVQYQRPVSKAYNHRTIIDKETGEEHQLLESEQALGDFNFYKFWLDNLLKVYDKCGSPRTVEVLFRLAKIANLENMIFCTVSELSKYTGFTKPTLKRALKLLMESNAITKVKNGVYMINPNLIFKGKATFRKQLAKQYGFYSTTQHTGIANGEWVGTDEDVKLDDDGKPIPRKKEKSANQKPLPKGEWLTELINFTFVFKYS